MVAINFEALNGLVDGDITNVSKSTYRGGEIVTMSLPWDEDLEKESGVSLEDNYSFGDLEWTFETSKVIITEYYFTELIQHKCVGNGMCNRCANNETRHYHLIRISGIKSKKSIDFLQWSGDRLGDVMGNLYRV